MLIGNIPVDTTKVRKGDIISVKCLEAKDYFSENPIDDCEDVLISSDLKSLVDLMETVDKFDQPKCYDMDIELGVHEDEYLFVGDKKDLEEKLPCVFTGLKERILYAVLWTLKH